LIFSRLKRKIAKIGLDPEWDVIIKPRTGWFDINLREVWRYRDLAKLYVYRDFTVTYKQTILGPAWWFVQPFLTSGIYSVIFGAIAGLPTDGVPMILFYVSGIVCWNYFSSCLTSTSNTFTVNAGVFSKVYFPRLVVPVAAALSDLFKFFIQFGLFLLVYFIYLFNSAAIQPNWCILLLPLLLAHIAIMAGGMGIIASSLTTKYKDLQFAMAYLIQLAMYATPIIYPFSLVPEKWRLLAMLNPMVPVIETFRLAFLGAGTVNLAMTLWSICFALLVLFLGVIFFSRVEKNFADTI
jgi:lipopolysaccharide transport system permease protein